MTKPMPETKPLALTVEEREKFWHWATSLTQVRERYEATCAQLEAELAQLRAQQGWRAVSVERLVNGRPVLVHFTREKYSGIAKAAYFKAGTLDMDDDVPEDAVDENGRNIHGGWFEDCESREPCYWPLNEDIQWWMPLPQPPSGEALATGTPPAPATHTQEIERLQAELKRTSFERDAMRNQYERMGLCPDHRDKFDIPARCIVCRAEERTRVEPVHLKAQAKAIVRHYESDK